MDMREEWLHGLWAWASANGNVQELWLFGSRADGHARPDSDVDIAIALMPAAFAYGNYVALGDGWQRELEAIVGRHVSLEATDQNTDEDACVRSTGVLLWSDAMKQTVIRCRAADVCDVFGRWLAAESAAGVRLVILEGAMLSGKSTLTKQPFVLGDDRRSTSIEIDKLTRETTDESYVASVRREALDAAVRNGLAASPTMIVQGAVAWPLVQAIGSEIGLDRVRRVYLKRMKWSDPDRWHDLRQFLDEDASPLHFGEVGNSIDRYHREYQPWRVADLILERVEAEGEDDQ
jgi:predicted nucleotidyltransferase